MKIDDRREKKPCGKPLSSFALGDCVRHVTGGTVSDEVYIVGATNHNPRLATNLAYGTYAITGLFVFEPNAKVVIE